jgi:glycerophosphoryl diester phosphodiesterase
MENLFLTSDGFYEWFDKDKPQIISHRLYFKKSNPLNPPENSLKAIEYLLSNLPDNTKIIVETDIRKASQSPHSFEDGIFISHDAIIKDLSGYQYDTEKMPIEEIREIQLADNENIPLYSDFIHHIYQIAQEKNQKVLINVEAKTEDCMQDIIEESLKMAKEISGSSNVIRLIPSSFNRLNMIDFHLNFPDKPAMLLIDDEEIESGAWVQKDALIQDIQVPSVGLSVNALLSPEVSKKTEAILSQVALNKKGITVFTVNTIDTFDAIKAKCHQHGIPLYAVFSDEYSTLISGQNV